MAEERTSGVILRTRPLTETSLIVHWLTTEQGRIATVAKGARRPKSPFRGKLDLFFITDFSFVRSRKSELHTLREVSVREPNAHLRTDLIYIRQAAYCAGLIEQTTESETPIPTITALFISLLSQVQKRPPQALAVFTFEIKLLQELGLMPSSGEVTLSPGAKQIFLRLAELGWEALDNLKTSASQATELKHFLHNFISFHLGKVPHGRVAALQDE